MRYLTVFAAVMVTIAAAAPATPGGPFAALERRESDTTASSGFVSETLSAYSISFYCDT
jgi:hypothetical protein